LQNYKRVKEIYMTSGEVDKSKLLLFVYNDGKLKLEWCWEHVVEIQDNPTLTKIGRKMILEYGEPNIFNQREKIQFQNEQGELESNWEKIL
jgi:hypothetical protein